MLQRGTHFQMLECLCREHHDAFTSVLYSIWPLKGGLQAVDSRERIGQEMVVLLRRGANFQMLECLCREQHAAFTSVFYSIWPLKGGLQAVDSRERIDQEIEVLLQRGTHFQMSECLCRAS